IVAALNAASTGEDAVVGRTSRRGPLAARFTRRPARRRASRVALGAVDALPVLGVATRGRDGSPREFAWFVHRRCRAVGDNRTSRLDGIVRAAVIGRELRPCGALAYWFSAHFKVVYTYPVGVPDRTIAAVTSG